MSQRDKKFIVELTECQKEYLQLLLPFKVCLRPKQFYVIDQKRNRVPKKLDQIYESQLFKKKLPIKIGKSAQKQDISEDKIKDDIKLEDDQKKIELKKNEDQNPKKAELQKDRLLQIDCKVKSSQKAKQINWFGNYKNNDKDGEKQMKEVSPLNNNEDNNNFSRSVSKIQNQLDKNKSKNDLLTTKIDPINSDNLNPFITTDLILSTFQKQCCLKFIDKLKSYKASWPFRLPVDPIKQGVPNYLEVIKQPMDLKTIQKKLISNKYQNVQDMKIDIMKIFLNSYKFNPHDSNYFNLTKQLETYYYELLSECEKDYSYLFQQNKKKLNTNKVDKEESGDFIENQLSLMDEKQIVTKKKKIVTNTQNSKRFSKIIRYSLEDKIRICKQICSLPSQLLQQILYLIYQSQDKQIGVNQMKFSIDLQSLQEHTIRALDCFLKNKKQKMKDSQKHKIQIF